MNEHWLVSETAADRGRKFTTRLVAAGRHLPETRLYTADLMASTRHHTHIDLERLTGIRERRVSTGEDDSFSLATAAARDCLAKAAQDASGVDVVINCSITKCRDGTTHWLEPSMSSSIARAVGAESAVTFDVANACAGMLTGVMLLNNWIQQGLVRRGLVVSGEYISGLGQNAARHIRNIASSELASLTLGDAGAALLLERAPVGAAGILFAGFTTIARYSRLCLAYPKGADPGARMFTHSRAIQQAALADTPALLAEVLEQLNLSIRDIDHVITHQTSARAIRKGMSELEARFGARARHDPVITVDRYGNTASTTHTVALVEELEAGHIRPGDTIALLSLASGLEIGVIVLIADEELVKRYGHSDRPA